MNAPAPSDPPSAVGSTLSYPHVLGLPGHDTAETPGTGETAAPGSGPSTAPPPALGSTPPGAGTDPTYGFGAVLPLPRPPAPRTPPPAAALAAPDPLEAPGATLSRYRLSGRLRSRGGVTVHAALHPVHGECRVSVLDLAAVPARGSAFLLEARLLAGLSAPALVPTLEVGHDPRPWLAQPVVAGTTLREALAREGPWPAPRVSELLRALARALAPAHGGGVAHGDIDSDQVLVLPDGSPRLIGFCAPAFVGHLGDRQPFPGGPSQGAAPYAPPEVQGGARADARGDVWALGLLALEALSGRPPYEGSSPREVQDRVVKGPPARSAWPPMPPALGAVLARCLQKDPRARFGDADELSRALEPAAGAGARGVTGRPAGAALLLLVLLLLAVGLLALLFDLLRG